jgi:hypothetical protein
MNVNLRFSVLRYPLLAQTLQRADSASKVLKKCGNKVDLAVKLYHTKNDGLANY